MNNETKPTISFVALSETEEAEQRMTSVRFDCLVKMFDFAQKESKSGMPFVAPKPLPPQWFKSEIRMTLEFVQYADPYEIGLAVKDTFIKLRQHISKDLVIAKTFS